MDKSKHSRVIDQYWKKLCAQGFEEASAWVARTLAFYEELITNPDSPVSKEPSRSEFEVDIDSLWGLKAGIDWMEQQVDTG